MGRIPGILLIVAGALMLVPPCGLLLWLLYAFLSKHEYAIGLSANLQVEAPVALLLLAIAGTALTTSGIWMQKSRKCL